MSDSVSCWNCGVSIEDSPELTPFRAVCDRCGSYLHLCKNCKYYSPGRSNDCSIPDLELVADKENFNYCEEFFLSGGVREKGKNQSEVERKIFGDEGNKMKKSSFDDLFN